MRNVVSIVVLGALWIGCGAAGQPAPVVAGSVQSTPGGEVESAQAAASAEATAGASQPDAAKLKAHVEKHIEYPATKAQIMEACAQTSEFSAAEKQWIHDTLPDGSYGSSAELLGALHVE